MSFDRAGNHAFASGDRVTWTWHAKGFGFSLKVAAIVTEVDGRYAHIVVAERQKGRWVTTPRRVPVCLLAPRRERVLELGED